MAKKAAPKRKPVPKVKLAPKGKAAAGSEAKRDGRGYAVAPRVPPTDLPTGIVLDRLFAVIESRRDADPAQSHSARLLSRGVAKVAQKFGEEAVECLIEAVTGNRAALVGESADVLYHLLVMWVAAGITPDIVWAELARREGVSGLAEKAARKQPVDTRKIP